MLLTLLKNFGQPIELIVQSEVVRDGYTLGDFELPSEESGEGFNFSGLIPGFNWYLVPVAAVTLLGCSLLIRKKKK